MFLIGHHAVARGEDFVHLTPRNEEPCPSSCALQDIRFSERLEISSQRHGGDPSEFGEFLGGDDLAPSESLLDPSASLCGQGGTHCAAGRVLAMDTPYLRQNGLS
jgi:hypothetical protein